MGRSRARSACAEQAHETISMNTLTYAWSHGLETIIIEILTKFDAACTSARPERPASGKFPAEHGKSSRLQLSAIVVRVVVSEGTAVSATLRRAPQSHLGSPAAACGAAATRRSPPPGPQRVLPMPVAVSGWGRRGRTGRAGDPGGRGRRGWPELGSDGSGSGLRDVVALSATGVCVCVCEPKQALGWRRSAPPAGVTTPPSSLADYVSGARGEAAPAGPLQVDGGATLR